MRRLIVTMAWCCVGILLAVALVRLSPWIFALRTEVLDWMKGVFR
jgi:hypothetical protein